MRTLVTVLGVPLLVLNLAGGIVAGVWLMFLGEWWPLVVGVAVIVGGAWACALLLSPSLLIGMFAALLFERGGIYRLVAYPLVLAVSLWTYVVMCVWTLLWFFYFSHSALSGSIIPMMLWAYTVATAPWSYMAQREAQGGEHTSSMAVFFLELGSVVGLVLLLCGAQASTAVLAFLAIMGATFLVNLYLGGASALSRS
jgi:hypothetical protein